MKNELATQVRRLSYFKGINQTELAKRAGVNRSTITRWMNGDCDLMSENLEKVMKVLGIDLGRVIANCSIETLQNHGRFRRQEPNVVK